MLVLTCNRVLAEPPETGARSDLGGMLNRYLTNLAVPLWSSHDRQIASLHTPQQVRAYQEQQRATFLALLGKFPPRTPLHPHITGTLMREGYRIQKLYFESQPGFYVTADLYLPTVGAGPFPAVLGVAGHSDPGKATDVYQRAWVAFVRRGFVVLAVDPLGQGERVQYYDRALGRSRLGPATTEHTLTGQQCLLTGATLAEYMVWDDIRSIDYLVTRPEVDKKRIGIAGSSGGGMQAAYMAMADPRIAVAAPSCWMNSSRTIWDEPGPQDAEQNLPGFLSSGMDITDYANAFATKPFLFLTATQDFFPIKGAHAAYDQARRIYALLGASDHVNSFEYNDEHAWSLPRREATYSWFQHWLQASPSVRPEETLATEKALALAATHTGQVATSMRGVTVQALNLQLAEKEAAHRTALPDGELRQQIVRILHLELPASSSIVPVQRTGAIDRGGYSVQQFVITTEPGISVPMLVLVPGKTISHAVIIYLDPHGKEGALAPDGEMEALVRSGSMVIAPDLRGWGESADRTGEGLHDGRYQAAMRALLVGKTMTGMQTLDLLRCVDFALQINPEASGKIALVGKGDGGVVALYAAALDPRISRLALEDSPVAYMDLVRSRSPRNRMDIILPGVLQYYDLADVARLVAPRPLWLIGPQEASGQPYLHSRNVLARYRSTYKAYAGLDRRSNLKVTCKLSGTRGQQALGAWLKTKHADAFTPGAESAQRRIE